MRKVFSCWTGSRQRSSSKGNNEPCRRANGIPGKECLNDAQQLNGHRGGEFYQSSGSGNKATCSNTTSYPMSCSTGSSAGRGLALVFNFYKAPACCDGNGGSNNNNCKSDNSQAMSRLLRKLGLIMHSFHNPSRGELLAELLAVANADHSQSDCLVVVLVLHSGTTSTSGWPATTACPSHSHNDDPSADSPPFAFIDSLRELLQPFADASNAGGSLNGKPKLFLIIQHVEADSEEPSLLLLPEGSSVTLKCADFLVCRYSTRLAGDKNCCGACNYTDMLGQELLRNSATAAAADAQSPAVVNVVQALARWPNMDNATEAPLIVSTLTKEWYW